MAIFDISTLTLNEEEATQVSQAIFERVITGGELSKHHDIVTGIQHKTQIPFIGNIGLVGKEMTSCTSPSNTGEIPITEKMWDPTLIGDRFKHCATDTNQLFKLFQKAKRVNPDYFDRVDSQEMGIIVARVESAMKSMLNRLVWFGDAAAALATNGGVFSAGTDLDYFNPIDGLWKQIFTEITASPATPNYVEITKNSGNSYANQVLDDKSALGIFRKMYNALDPRFFQALDDGAEPVLFVTRALFQNYQDELEDKSLAFTLAEAKDGTSGLSYRGIPIVVRHDWDNIIQAYQDNGVTHNLPHRALLTVKENIPVGTLSTEDLDKLKSWYREFDLSNYIDIQLMLDTKHLLDYMSVAAY